MSCAFSPPSSHHGFVPSRCSPVACRLPRVQILLRNRLGWEFSCCTTRIEPDQSTTRQNRSPSPPYMPLPHLPPPPHPQLSSWVIIVRTVSSERCILDGGISQAFITGMKMYLISGLCSSVFVFSHSQKVLGSLMIRGAPFSDLKCFGNVYGRNGASFDPDSPQRRLTFWC